MLVELWPERMAGLSAVCEQLPGSGVRSVQMAAHSAAVLSIARRPGSSIRSNLSSLSLLLFFSLLSPRRPRPLPPARLPHPACLSRCPPLPPLPPLPLSLPPLSSLQRGSPQRVLRGSSSGSQPSKKIRWSRAFWVYGGLSLPQPRHLHMLSGRHFLNHGFSFSVRRQTGDGGGSCSSV